ncbi:MAG: hypothetical protein ACHQAY_00760 [Hyphomicrobiales bacterium]
MSKLLADAIAKAQTLPDERQDEVAEAMFASMAERVVRHGLSDAQLEEVRRIQQDLREGKARLVADGEIAAFWKRCGL